MKCSACWAEKVYLREVKGWKARLLVAFRLAVPMRCHHCYHRFWVPWILTLGKQVRPPETKTPAETAPRLSYAARHWANQQEPRAASTTLQTPSRSSRTAS